MRQKIINVHAGHAAYKKGACGAVGFLNESNQARKIAKQVIKRLRSAGYKVYNCTVDKGDQNQVLSGIIKKCNAHKADLDVSIHLNSGRKDSEGDGKTGGCEVLLTSNTGTKGRCAKEICKEIAKLGFTNRGVKVRNDLRFLNQTIAPAVLVECCFVDDRDDYIRYKKVQYKKMAKAIADGIIRGIDQ